MGTWWRRNEGVSYLFYFDAQIIVCKSIYPSLSCPSWCHLEIAGQYQLNTLFRLASNKWRCCTPRHPRWIRWLPHRSVETPFICGELRWWSSTVLCWTGCKVWHKLQCHHQAKVPDTCTYPCRRPTKNPSHLESPPRHETNYLGWRTAQDHHANTHFWVLAPWGNGRCIVIVIVTGHLGQWHSQS